jgi:PAS domain S-box-containing protein
VANDGLTLVERGIKVLLVGMAVIGASLVLLCPLPQEALASVEQKRILVLYSQDHGLPAHELTDKAIRTAVKVNPNYAVQIFSEFLDLSRFGGFQYKEDLGRFLGEKYASARPDLIVAADYRAADFIVNYGGPAFSGIPIVVASMFASEAEKLETRGLRQRVTGGILEADIGGLLPLLGTLKPGTGRIALVGGASETDQYLYAVIRNALKRQASDLEVIELAGLAMPQLLERVGSLPPVSVILYLSVFADGDGRQFVPREALSMVSRGANVPVFGLFDSYLGYGIVGGHQISFQAQGRMAAENAFRIFAGESPGAIPLTVADTHPYEFDWRELKRWGIPEAALPPGSTVINKEFSLWESYRWPIVGILAFGLIQTLLIAGLMVNLHQRRRAEKALASSEERYRTVADFTHDWEYWSAPDGSLNYVSPSCERITGYSPQEFLDNPSLRYEIIVPEDRPIYDRHRRESGTESESQEIQFRILTRDGMIRWIDHACRPVIDHHGQFQGFRASNRDVTERKTAETKVQQHRDELSHVTRVAAMGELTGSLAHELNQPLAAILNYASAAQRFLAGAEPNMSKLSEALHGIIQNDKRAAEVVRNVRALLKKQGPDYSILDVNHLIKEYLDLIPGESIMGGLSITTELAPGLPTVRGDAVQLQQVLLNLTLNAATAMSQVMPDSPGLVVRTEIWEDQGVKVSVSDFGPGIDEDHEDRLFEPFYTTKPKGLGMGLAICQNIVHAHGGSIWAENNPDRGATFYFTLRAAVGGTAGQ